MPPLIKGDEMTNDNELHSEISCKECQMGRLSRRYVTYITWLGDEMITVPDFPAWICDICGKLEYDLQALDNLALMLNPPPKAKRVSKFRHPSNKSKQAPLGKRA